MGLVLFAFVLSFLQSKARAGGKISFTDQAVRLVCTPIASVSGSMVRGVTGFFSGALHSRGLQEENKMLRRQLETLSLYAETIPRLEREVNSARAEMQLDKTYQREKVVAQISGYFPQESRITLNVGRDRGITEGMPAVCAQGLVGKVQAVGLKDCQVLLLTSSAMQLGGIASKYNPPPAGLIHGENSPTLVMKFLTPDCPVSSGDIIYTSGFSTQIPKGIVIGRVLSAESLPEMGSSRARIFPAVSSGELSAVVILK